MTIDRARELLNLQINMGSGSGYNRNSAMLLLAEPQSRLVGFSCSDAQWLRQSQNPQEGLNPV